MRIAFKNFGCRANSFETDTLYLEALKRGIKVVSEFDQADAYIINSCTVTANANKDTRSQVNRFKRQSPESVVAVVGCYSQVAKEELLGLEGVDIVLGTADKFKVLDVIGQSNAKRDQVGPPTGFLPTEFLGSSHARANIKIQDGCNYKCTFCTIPMARGRSRSLNPQQVIHLVREASFQGFKEIVLTGIHLAHYGWEHNADLNSLLAQLSAVPNVPRIRLSTLDPFEIPEGLLDMMEEGDFLCPFLHIALQSGDDSVLSRMRRLYKADEFVQVTEQMRARIPDAFIGVDVIVGFPGETKESFQKTLSLLEETHWSKLHVFSFSARKGTVAETLDGQVGRSEIAHRSRVLRTLSEKRFQQFLFNQIGQERALLLENPSKKIVGSWLGHTENYVPAELFMPNGKSKDIVSVKLMSAERTLAHATVV